jgi:hypothetical protein
MPEFPSHRSYRDFAVLVSQRWRYARPPEMTDFLETVLSTAGKKEEVIAAGTILFRAQLGHDWRPEPVAEGVTEELPCAFSPERMKPRPDRAVEGRANPKGIPCLYVGTHTKTSVAEVRPWIGALVSVARLKTTRPLRVVNCTVDKHTSKLYFQEPSPDERERVVWQDIDRAFSEPVAPSDDEASYAPTQVLAEAFRQSGFDGVAYRSAVGTGHNIAIFDSAAADLISCGLVVVDRLSLDYHEADNPYFVTKNLRDPAGGAERGDEADIAPGEAWGRGMRM